MMSGEDSWYTIKKILTEFMEELIPRLKQKSLIK